MTSTAPRPRPSTRRRQYGGGLAVALVAAATWGAWLGWDHGYRTDPATGTVSGPYATWQVAGCAGTLLLLVAAAVALRVHPLVVAATATVAFTAAWSVDAARADDTGLWPVGAALLFLGLATGTTVVSFIVYAVTHRPRPTHT